MMYDKKYEKDYLFVASEQAGLDNGAINNAKRYNTNVGQRNLPV